jgi:hypothetical protein
VVLGSLGDGVMTESDHAYLEDLNSPTPIGRGAGRSMRPMGQLPNNDMRCLVSTEALFGVHVFAGAGTLVAMLN